MVLIAGILASYLLLLNIVVSIRIVRDDTEELWRKVLFVFLVWIVPFFGAFFISLLLNAISYKPKGWWLSHPAVTRFVTTLFIIKISHPKTFAGYPSDANNYGWYNGAWDGGWHCDGFGDGGACGGDGGGGD